MEELSLTQVIGFIGSKVVLMTLLPSLLLNAIMDSIDNANIFNPTNKISKLFITNGLLSLLGLLFGILYYLALNIPLDESILHALAITGVSYLFCKVDIFDLAKKTINKKLEGKSVNE